MKLEPGMTAPSFEVEDAHGRIWRVPQGLEGKHLLLIFLRHLGCPLCARRLDEIAAGYSAFDAAGADVMAVVEAGRERARSYAAGKGLPMALVGDKEKNLYRGYSVGTGSLRSFMSPRVIRETVRATMKGYFHGRPEGNELQKPAEFIISPDGKIAWAHYGEDISDFAGNDELVAQLKTITGK